MMNVKTRVLGLVMAAGCLTTAASAQQAPAALDLVSPDTPLVVGVKSLQELQGDASRWANTLMPGEMGMQLGMMEQMLSIPGLNPEGSMAVALTMPEGTMRSEPIPTLVVPVEDYAAFVEAMQGNPSDTISALNLDGETMYAKDLPGGFIAMSPVMGAVESFAGEPGNNAKHAARMGKRGTQAALGADIFLVADVESLRPLLEEGLSQAKEQMQFAAMMGGEAAAEQINTMMQIADAVVNDAQTAVIGLGADDTGLWIDFAGQFADGSDTGKIFADSGDSSKLLGSVPSMDYIFAMAYDSSSSGMQQLMAGAAELNSGSSFTMSSPEIAKLSKGQAMVMGTTPGLFAGGLFTNSVAFTATDEPAKLRTAMKDAMAEMDGSSEEGMMFKTSFEENAAEVAGTSLDAWSLQMEADYNHPNAAAAGMAIGQMSMLFGGQSGPSGYLATTDKGVYSSFAKNSQLMEKVLAGGESMAGNAQILAAAERLPADRTAEFYLNIKGVLDMVQPLMAMFAPGTDLGRIPETMSPIAMGLSTGENGMHTRLFVPGDVLEFGAAFAQQMGGGGDWDDVDDEPGGRPRF